MKKLLLFLPLFIAISCIAQESSKNSGGLLKKAGGLLNKAKGGSSGSLTEADVIAGLKEALSVGAKNSSEKLSATDGFFGNQLIKVLMPDEAKKVESTLRNLGMGQMVDKAILSMNRAAEEASKSAGNIFLSAIKQMSVQDAMGILRGSDSAATSYLRSKTWNELTDSFKPVIDEALKKTDATKYWKDVFETYNKLPTTMKKVNTDLPTYVTGKALNGLFYQVALEEQKIRKDPAARVNDILKKVFGS